MSQEAPHGYHPGTRIPRKKPDAAPHEGRGTCKRCGADGLVWELQGGWFLCEVGGKRHRCPPKQGEA